MSPNRSAQRIRVWFSPERWSQNDLIIAAAALVLAVSVFLPWFRAAVRFRRSAVTGFLMSPPGTVSGVSARGFLWVVFALALTQFAVLAARYVPGRPAFTLPGHQWLLAITSGLVLAGVIAAGVLKPSPWYGNGNLGEGIYVTVSWAYGVLVALAASLVSLGIGISAIRDR